MKTEDPFDDIDPEVEGDHLSGEPNTARLNDETRERWLRHAVSLLIPLLEQAGAANLRTRQIAVSVGFPSKSVRVRIGECWPGTASTGGQTNHMFISPLMDDAVKVLGVLAHELIHADDNGASHHNGHFRRVAKALGLTGKMTSTEVGPELEVILKDMIGELGPYPHVRLNLGTLESRPKQATRMKKLMCPMDGYIVRTTQSCIDKGLPSCPCGATMRVA